MFLRFMCGVTLSASPTFATDLYVNASSGPFVTIQSAINAAAAGDRVLVQDLGMVTDYVEDIDFLGKDIEVRNDPANTFDVAIVGTGTGPVVTLASGEPLTAKLAHLFVKGGSALFGGGIHVENSACLIEDVAVNHCRASFGGGISIVNSIVGMTAVKVKQNNEAGSGFYGLAGGGIYIDRSLVWLKIGCVDLNRSELGGGIYVTESRLDVSGVTFSFNESDSGGGVHLDSSQYLTVFSGCGFYENLARVMAAPPPSVGAGAMVYEAEVHFLECEFDLNRNMDGPGGGIAANYASMLIEDSEIKRNWSRLGGGLAMKRSKAEVYRTAFSLNESTTNGGGILLDNRDTFLYGEECRLENNTARRGGGLASGHETSFHLVQSQLSNNTANRFGGGIFARGSVGARLLEQTRVDQNVAGAHGGGIFIAGNAPFDVIAQSSISDNTAAYDGGGIFALSAWLTMDNSFCCFNTAGGLGGGLRSISCSPLLQNSVLSNNTPTDIDGPFINLASSIGGGC